MGRDKFIKLLHRAITDDYPSAVMVEYDRLCNDYAKLREALNLACIYAQDDEHDWSDIVRVTSNALLETE